MDYIRSCYRTKMRLRAGDTRTTKVRWFFVPEGTPPLPFPTATASLNWVSDKDAPQEVGEVPKARREWVDGSRPPWWPGPLIGTPEAFYSGASETAPDRAIPLWCPRGPEFCLCFSVDADVTYTSGESADVAVLLYPSQNVDSVPFARGMALATAPSGSGVLRVANGDMGAEVSGLATLGVGVGSTETVQGEGILQVPDWSAVTGTVTLAARATYWLGPTEGSLTNTPPSTPGLISQVVGHAVSPDTLYIDIQEPILL